MIYGVEQFKTVRNDPTTELTAFFTSRLNPIPKLELAGCIPITKI
jgi:hypothetical protein